MKYDKNCKKCHGSGCLYVAYGDPPEECDCWDRWQPDDESSESNAESEASQ